MEIEKNPPKMGKKLWKILRIAFYMMNKSIGKSELMLDLQTLLKRGKSALIDGSYYSVITCRCTNDGHASFISPGAYEFSCSNTPAHHTKHKNHRQQYYYRRPEDQVSAVQKVLEMLNRAEFSEASPLNFPGSRRSPYTVRQLRVTDSPFAQTDVTAGESSQVDKDCEEFINKFYRSLKKERRIAALESPSPYHFWAR